MTAAIVPGVAPGAEIELGEPHGPARKICIIGNSYIGALLQAYREFSHEPWHHEFSFIGAATEDFHQLAIRGGKITGFGHKTAGASELLADYDNFVVYGDMMPPHEISNFEAQLGTGKHSRGLRNVIMNDWTRMRHSRTLAEQIAATARVPVFMLSRNITVEDRPKDFEQYMFGVTKLREFLAPVIFMELPYEIIGEGFITNQIYHKSSRELSGGLSSHAGHDLAHMNLAGGRMVLRHIVRSINEHYFRQG